MADEAKGGDAAHGAPAAAKGGGGGLKWMIIAAVASLASAGGTFLVVSRSATQADPAGAEARAEKGASEHGEKAEDSHEEKSKEAKAEPEPEEEGHGGGKEAAGHGETEGHGGGHAATPNDAPAVFTMETFIVNINDGERDRFLKLKPELELTASAVSDELKANMPQVKDTIISLLSSQSFAQIRSVEGKDLLREELMVRLNALLKTGKVNRIFFTEFVVQ